MDSIFTLHYSSYKLRTKTNQLYPYSETYLEPFQASMVNHFIEIAHK